MYYRNPDYLDVERLARPKMGARGMPEIPPRSLSNRLILSIGMIVAPVVTFFVALAIVRLVAAF